MITFDGSFLPIWLPFSLLVLFILVWFTTLLLTSVLGGWLRLADKFPRREKPTGTPLKYVSASMNYGTKARRLFRANYGKLLNLWVDQNGITITALPIFRPAHPAIHLPWSAIKQGESKDENVLVLTVQAPATTITMRGKGAQEIRKFLGSRE